MPADIDAGIKHVLIYVYIYIYIQTHFTYTIHMNVNIAYFSTYIAPLGLLILASLKIKKAYKTLVLNRFEELLRLREKAKEARLPGTLVAERCSFALFHCLGFVYLERQWPIVMG